MVASKGLRCARSSDPLRSAIACACVCMRRRSIAPTCCSDAVITLRRRARPANIPGLEFAGEVEQVGADVRTWRTGARVFGITGGGAQAEYVVVPEDALAEIPDTLDWTAAAAVPEAFITAHDALFTQGALALSERVLIHAAGSGVGLAAIQLAHAAGASVCGTARTAEKLERARAFGLDEAVPVG